MRRKEMIDKTSQLGVPVIVIGDKVIVGFDQEAIAKALGNKK
jgi:glutaredoxin